MNMCKAIYTYSIYFKACFSKLFCHTDIIRESYESPEQGIIYFP